MKSTACQMKLVLFFLKLLFLFNDPVSVFAYFQLISSTEDRKQETETLADHAIVIGGNMFSLPGRGFRLDNRIDITRR